MTEIPQPSTSRSRKSDAAFRTISEVATELDVPQHVLRFWESKFTQVKPLKRGGGRRYYRPEDVALLKRIRALLYDDGLTIKGVQKLFREHGLKVVLGGERGGMTAISAPDNTSESKREAPVDLSALTLELRQLSSVLRSALGAR